MLPDHTNQGFEPAQSLLQSSWEQAMERGGEGVESSASRALGTLLTSHAPTTTTKVRNPQNKKVYYGVIIASTLTLYILIQLSPISIN